MSFVTQALGEFHREDELYNIVLRVPPQDIGRLGDVWFRPALRKFRQDPRFMQVAAKGGLAAYWRKSGHWPDFCSEPDLRYDCKKEAAKLLT